MKWLLYNALFAVAYAAMLPSFLIRMKRRGGYRARMGDRFGRYPFAFPRGAVWIHAVSVGEVQVAGQLMRALRAQDPSVRFVFSTTSSTGWKQAEGQVAPGDALIYNPLDFPRVVRRALDAVRPRAIILTESEIWPNFIRAAKKRGIPLFLVNARVSDRSAPRYRALRWFFGEVFRCFTRIFAQSDLDARRLVAAGADPAAVETTGSFKFDAARRNPAKEQELRAWIGPGEILLGASIWPGEDEALLRIYADLAKKRSEVKLVLAPRHFEKADAVEANVRAAGFDCLRRSRADGAPSEFRLSAFAYHPVSLCDTTGELMGLYGLASVAFVGKSLCAHGSQNMIEPCLCGVPTLVGPHTENFRPVMSDLLAADAVVQVPDEAALKREIFRLFDDKDARAALGARAVAAVERRRGATDRCAAALLRAFPPAPAEEDAPAAVPSARRGRRWRRLGLAAAALAAVYLASWPFAVPKVRHGWEYLQMNAGRTYASFVGLAAATALYPACVPDARAACRALRARETPGTDEFGVRRYAATQRLAACLPQAFPGRTTVRFDARLASLADLRRAHDAMVAAEGGYWLWCVGRYDYLLVSKRANGADAPTVEAAALFAAFSEAFEAFAAAGIYSPADLFACYVGDDAEIAPALAEVTVRDRLLSTLLPLRLAFRPEPAGGRAAAAPARVTPVGVPTLDWLERGGVDVRVFFEFTDRTDACQTARRDLLMGFTAAEAGAATNALAKWAAAAKVNPHDPLLANLADALDLEGRRFLKIGNVNGAMRCYENRLLIRPDDVAAVHNFGVCLKKSGHLAMAATVFAKAVRMDPQTDAHRLELIETCAASGHEDIATRQIEVLLKRDPHDAALKTRAAKLLASRTNAARDTARAVALAEEAVRLTDWKDRACVEGLADVYIAVGRAVLGMGLKKKMRDMRFDR